MAKDKYDFISDFLTNPKLNPAQKERAFLLAKKEIEKDSILGRELEERVRKIESILKNNKNIKYSVDNKNEIFPKPNHAPKTAEILKNFTLNDSNLKYTTHDWESGKFESYQQFMTLVRSEWNQISEELKDLNVRLHAKISNFLFSKKLGIDKKVWGEKKLNFGWSSPELKKFMDDESNNDPFKFMIPENIKELDKKYNLIFFEEYVKIFKCEIEIREDEKNLMKIINKLYKDTLSFDFTITKIGIDGKSFFTDVALLTEALNIIFKMMKKYPLFPNIKITLESINDFILLKITQIDSFCNRERVDQKIAKPNGGDFGSLIKLLKNIADLSIESKFPDGKTYRISYLSSDDNEKHIQKIDSNEGFTYVLKFYL